MTFGYGAGAQPDGWSEKILLNQEAEDCLIPMGITSENVAADYGISRQVQDDFAAKSFQKAAQAQKDGKFPEIVPLTVTWVDPKTEKESQVTIDKDDGVRGGVTAESLGKLKPAFDKNGTTHAGNASQVSDGAAATLLARRSVAKKLGLPILGKFVGAIAVGVPPRIMGVGPAYAIPAVLENNGLSTDDVDFYEVCCEFGTNSTCADQISIDQRGLRVAGSVLGPNHWRSFREGQLVGRCHRHWSPIGMQYVFIFHFPDMFLT